MMMRTCLIVVISCYQSLITVHGAKMCKLPTLRDKEMKRNQFIPNSYSGFFSLFLLFLCTLLSGILESWIKSWLWLQKLPSNFGCG